MTLVMVPNEPKELKRGMICRSVKDDDDPNFFYFIEEDLEGLNIEQNQSVLPYIIEKDEAKIINPDSLYLFNFSDGGCCIAYHKEIFDHTDISNFFEVKVEPENIGIVQKKDKENNLIDIDDINKIMTNGGWCYVEMEDEFTNPEKFTDVGWGDSIPRTKLQDGRYCIITY